ncbi:MAG TPA: adenylosuccinate synthase [Phycisphaerae bacterium]|nr:adenylosuccinate synthase [Phycisphaerae bacterium]HPS52039.1 adenylosuccinate synthase [Phycisphaerae bacterium]
MESNNITVVGLQWGDEGKGKIVDALARTSCYVTRYCGGANAGHTVKAGGEKFALHLIPCGILHEKVINVIGNGVAFDPEVAWGEIVALRERHIRIDSENFRISSCAQLVMPWHKYQDKLNEQSLGRNKIGTTARGIGPCYADKANRSTSIRACDLLDVASLEQKIRHIGQQKNTVFAALYNAAPMDIGTIVAQFRSLAENLSPMICNTSALLRNACQAGRRILFEGGQGSMLDIDHGTYPYVTSSPVTACGVPAGAGVSPKSVGRVLGIMKAYTTRVGAGPFPTELDNEIGQAIRDAGHEYGTTTGRPRRCGWLDAMVVRYTASLSGVDELALMLLDVLTGFDELKICTGYKIDGEIVKDFDPARLDEVECVYETMPGWQQDITDCRKFSELPAEAQNYVRRISEIVGVPVGIISVGPERTQTILHESEIKELA